MTNKVLCYTMADKGGVCINGIQFPNTDDGWKKIVLTDEIARNFDRPWIDLRVTDLKIWASDCDSKKVYTFTEQDIGDWSVEIVSANVFSKIKELVLTRVKNGDENESDSD